MVKRVKILGAGSIGNHLAHAARALGWDVVVCDPDPGALKRMREEIYPARYSQWDDAIHLDLPDQAPKGGFDLICVGTPPDYHLTVALEALEESPKAIQIEKPLCTPGLEHASQFRQRARDADIRVFVGYDHVVGRASIQMEDMIRKRLIGEIKTLDVEFREHWGGIFRAHPWLDGPGDSYLGDWKRGGGASGEHSHALNLWQHWAHVIGAGRVQKISAMMDYVTGDGVDYDELCCLHLKTDQGISGRVVQDVITDPVKKRAWVQGTEGALEWINGHHPGKDAVIHHLPGGEDQKIIEFSKTRPDDFIQELSHIDRAMSSESHDSPLELDRGLETMLVVAAAHQSSREDRWISLKEPRTYTQEDLF